MEISLKEIEELFRETKIEYIGDLRQKGAFICGPNNGYIDITESVRRHMSSRPYKVTKFDISNLPLERQIKISELFESRKKGELTIR